MHIFTTLKSHNKIILETSQPHHVHIYLYEGCLKSSWTGSNVPLLCTGRWWLLCQVVVMEVT